MTFGRADGRIWIATHRGWRSLTRAICRPRRFRTNCDSIIYSIAVDSAGGLWFRLPAQGSRMGWNLAPGMVDGERVGGDYVTSMVEDDEGTVWLAPIADCRGGPRRLLPVAGTESVSAEHISTIYRTGRALVDRDGKRALRAMPARIEVVAAMKRRSG